MCDNCALRGEAASATREDSICCVQLEVCVLLNRESPAPKRDGSSLQLQRPACRAGRSDCRTGGVVEQQRATRDRRSSSIVVKPANRSCVEGELPGDSKIARAVNVECGVAEQRDGAGFFKARERCPAKHQADCRVECAGVFELDADLPAVERDHSRIQPCRRIERRAIRGVERHVCARDVCAGTDVHLRVCGATEPVANHLRPLVAGHADQRAVATEFERVAACLHRAFLQNLRTRRERESPICSEDDFRSAERRARVVQPEIVRLHGDDRGVRADFADAANQQTLRAK